MHHVFGFQQSDILTMAALKKGHLSVGEKTVAQFPQPGTHQRQRQRLSLGYVLNIATESPHLGSVARVNLIDTEQHSRFVGGRLLGQMGQPVAVVELLMLLSWHPIDACTQ